MSYQTFTRKFIEHIQHNASYLQRFNQWGVLLNQAGSLLYYVAFSQTDLSLLVPICNALALVFSIGTSVWIGESIRRPLQTTVGCGLIMMGVALCLVAQNDVVWDDDDVK